MYIEVEGQNYLITVNPSIEKIVISALKDNYIQISSPANLPQSELLVYLKNNKNQLIKTFNKTFQIEEIQIFDHTFSFHRKEGLQEPYIQNNAVYSPANFSSQRQKQKLKEKLLLQELMNLIGTWEERLNHLVHEINLRPFKTNHYTVCYKTNNMTFSKSLTNRNRNFIAYIVASALFDKLKLEENIREELFEKYVKDWKFSKKIDIHDRFK